MKKTIKIIIFILLIFGILFFSYINFSVCKNEKETLRYDIINLEKQLGEIKMNNENLEKQLREQKHINNNLENEIENSITEMFIKENLEYSGDNSARIEILNFDDNEFAKLDKYKNLDNLYIEFGLSKNKLFSMENTLKYLKEHFFKNNSEHDFSIEIYDYNLNGEELNIISKINITYFGIIGGDYPKINLPNPSIKEQDKYKKDVEKFDNNIKSVLKNSKTLNEIIVLDYKIFTKIDGKINIEDTRMNDELLNELGL